MAGGGGAVARRYTAAGPGRDRGGASGVPAGVPGLQPGAPRCARGGDPGDTDASLAGRADPRRVRAAAGDRGQDGRPTRARSDGPAHGLRARRADGPDRARPAVSADALPVFVEAPARLHFGVLDLRGDLGRRFGGIGAAVPAPSLLLEALPAGELRAEGPDAARALAFAHRFAAHHGIRPGVQFCLHRTIPPHVGLGSGTQLALAVARAMAELYRLPTDVTSLARAVDRGRRSAVGTWTFALGGSVVEGRRRAGDEGPAPPPPPPPLPPAA